MRGKVGCLENTARMMIRAWLMSLYVSNVTASVYCSSHYDFPRSSGRTRRIRRMSAAKKQKTAKARCAIVTTTIYVRTFIALACREQC